MCPWGGGVALGFKFNLRKKKNSKIEQFYWYGANFWFKEFTLGSRCKVRENEVAVMWHQISRVPTQENVDLNLRNQSSNLGPILSWKQGPIKGFFGPQVFWMQTMFFLWLREAKLQVCTKSDMAIFSFFSLENQNLEKEGKKSTRQQWYGISQPTMHQRERREETLTIGQRDWNARSTHPVRSNVMYLTYVVTDTIDILTVSLWSTSKF